MLDPESTRGRLRERAVVLGLLITCIIVFPVFGLVFYAIRNKVPIKIKAHVFKVVGFDIELDGQGERKLAELPSGHETPAAPDKTL